MPKRILSRIWVLVLLAICSLATGTILSVHLDAWHYLERFSALVTLFGALLSIRKIVRLGLSKFIEEQSTFDGGTLPPTDEELESVRQDKLDTLAVVVGFWMVVVGTTLNAFGSLVAPAVLRFLRSVTGL